MTLALLDACGHPQVPKLLATRQKRGEESEADRFKGAARRCNPCLTLCGWRREMATRTEGSALSLVGGGRAGGEEEDHRVDEIKSFSLVWSERRRPTSQVNRQRSGQILRGRQARPSVVQPQPRVIPCSWVTGRNWNRGHWNGAVRQRSPDLLRNVLLLYLPLIHFKLSTES